MPEPSASDRDEFLQRIADRLPFDDAEKLDILRELAGHLADATARYEAEGLPRDVAERAALDRLGSPDRLADGLTKARHTPRRLLAAAGAGTWAAVSGVVYGYIFALLVLFGVSTCTVLLAASPLHVFGGSWGSLLDTTAMTLVALGVGAYVAGQKITQTVATQAGYRTAIARRVTALLGGGLVLGYAVIGWRGALNWPEVGMLLSLPAWFVGGAWRVTDARFPSRRWRLGVIGLLFAIVPLALTVGMGQQPQTMGSGAFHPSGVEKIGLPTPAVIVAAAQDAGPAVTNAYGTVWISMMVDDSTVLAGWSDFRVEAWRGLSSREVDPGLAGAVDPTAKAPFAIGPARLEMAQASFGVGPIEGALPDRSARLSGSVTIDRSPTVTLAWVALTGVGPDGRRYILGGPSFESTAFNGTALDWLAAVISPR